MKRYKHLRTNKVAVLDEGKNIYSIADNSSETIPVCFVENSNDWKLIPEREWEVIGFSTNGVGTTKIDYSPEYLQSIGASIRILKRISDGMNFNIGDLITWDDIGSSTQSYYDSLTGSNFIRIDKFRYENSTMTEDIIVNDKYSLNSILARNPKRFDETPDFEILKFSDQRNYYFKKENGMFTINLQYEYTAEELLKRARIISIKRTKDNVVFSIGDRTNFGVITGFAIDDKLYKPLRIKVGFSEIGEKMMSAVKYLSTVVKLEPIFTTEDDVDIYQGDECWYALPRDSFEGKYTLKKRKCNGRAVEGKYFFHKHNAENYIFSKSEVIYFVDKINWVVVKSTDIEKMKGFSSAIKYKTEEDANKYIELNKPHYSVNDIKKFISEYVSDTFAHIIFDKFIKSTRKYESNHNK